MSDKKHCEGGVPLPIQLFLWRQTSPFIRPKLGKLHEATCVEMKEASKCLEKVLVQNILFGLSPSLTDAIKSISRWKLIQTAFPFVIHCAASLLHNRRESNLQGLGAVDTKLLYTLHWVLLDAADECRDADVEMGTLNTMPFHYLFPITAIQVFIYLFTPLMHSLKESDFATFRLENGLRIWSALWEYRHPEVACFTAAVRPRSAGGLSSRSKKQGFGDVFIGAARSGRTAAAAAEDGTSAARAGADDGCDGQGWRGPQPEPAGNSEPAGKDATARGGTAGTAREPHATSFPETIPEETSSIEEEHVMIFRLGSLPEEEEDELRGRPKVYKIPPRMLTRKQECLSSPDEQRSTSFSQLPGASELEACSSRTSHTPSGLVNLSLATFTDVAVLRCLFIPQWVEEGVFWAVQFLFYRLREMTNDGTDEDVPRKRSNSLPVPKIEVSLYQSPETKRREASSREAAAASPDPKASAEFPSSGCDALHKRSASERTRKGKTRIADLCAFVETKLKSRSQTMLEKLAGDAGSRRGSVNYPSSGSQCDLHDPESRPRSVIDHHMGHGENFSTVERQPFDAVFGQSLSKGKSMPSLRYMGVPQMRQPTKSAASRIASVPHPIITVTQHTPSSTPTPTVSDETGGGGGARPFIREMARKPLNRSYSDSDVSYCAEEQVEAPGSTYYINKQGGIDLIMLLKYDQRKLADGRQGLHSVVSRGRNINTLRVTEAVVSLLEMVLTMDVMALEREEERPDGEEPLDTPEKTARVSGVHHLYMDILVRSFRHMGCAHGCREGYRGPSAEFLRSQAQLLLTRLLKIDELNFKKFFREMASQSSIHDLMEFLHSFVGWCGDHGQAASPNNQKRGGSKQQTDAAHQFGYATNFGAARGTASIRGVEGQMVGLLFGEYARRLVAMARELKQPENLALYHDVRQFVTYVRDHHGCVFRRVLLSGFLDSTDRLNRQNTIITTKLVRRIHTLTEPGSRESPTNFYPVDDAPVQDRTLKKSIFKKKSTVASLSSVIKKTPSVQSVLDLDGDDSPPGPSPASTIRRKHRHSTRAAPEDHRQVSRIASLFRREGRERSEEAADHGDFGDRNRRHSMYRAIRNSRGGTVSLSLYRARKRMEDQLSRIGLGRSRRKEGAAEDVPDRSRHNSWDFDGCPQSLEYMIVKECRLVNTTAVRNGMKIMNLLMEASAPGTVPDAPLVATAFTLPGVPVTTRACFYLECAHFVHRCNKGMWPGWMKLHLPLFRSSGPLHNKPVTGTKRTHVLQRAAGKLFYQWAEALGCRLEMVLEESQQAGTPEHGLDDARKRQLRLDDDEEDFLDEASVNPTGKDCPMALRLACCVLLHEITAFMRETYPLLPRTFQLPQRERAPSMLGVPSGSRRWSTALSSMGYSQTSAQSLQSISGEHGSASAAERKISFVLHEPDEVSLCSSQNTLMQEEGCSRTARIAAGARSHLLKRSGGPAFFNSSFRRRSIKLRKGAGKEKDPDAESIKRSDSIKLRRKVSGISDCSGASDQHSGEESPAVLSDEQLADTPSDADTDDFSPPEQLPWVRVVTRLVTGLSYNCRHQQFCEPTCHKRQARACNRLIKAVKHTYNETSAGASATEPSKGSSRQSSNKDRSRIKRTEASTHSSPVKRKESMGRRDRIDRNPDGVAARLGLHTGGSIHYSKETLDSDVERGGGGGDTSSISGPERRAPKEEAPIVKYITAQVHTLFHTPLNLLAKCAVVLSEDVLLQILPVSWQLLLDTDQEVAASAASLFILSAVKIPGFTTDTLTRHLQHEDPAERVSSILRFHALWRFRHHCWPRMEDTAHLSFKVPPPAIEFTLPSPKIGIETLPVVDPSWMPQVKSKVEDVTLKEELHSIVSAGKTRRKQQAELVQIALMKEEEKKRLDREDYLISTVPVTVQAAQEPSFYHLGVDDHEEATDEEPAEVVRGAHAQSAPQMFPSSLCAAATDIIALLDDTAVTPDGVAVFCVAQRVIWKCLVEDSALFLRHFLEKLTRERQEVMVQYLRRLVHTYPRLPAQTAFALYNYLVGYIMFQIRSNSDSATQNIANSLTLLWMVIPGIQGILFKDLKQIFRKEQCDATLMLTANVPSAKRIIVHGPQGPDAGGIPSQFPVQEDTQFCQILTEVREFFGIAEQDYNSYFLVDHKTGVIHSPRSYVRDFYFFKRSQYPQLSLIHLDPEEAFNAMQTHAFYLKLLEIGKTLKSLAMLMRSDQVAQRVFFLHEELTKLPAFPRKALETEFHLHNGGPLGKELKGLDGMHKLIWVKMMSRMFEGMAGNFAYSGDIHLFINVVNGCLLLHCEDSAMLRLVMATFISAAHQFKNVFSSNGYLLIMPTILQVYSNHQSNSLLCRTVEFICKQFYVLHRKPFVLQMLGSIAPMLDLDTDSPYADANKIQPDTLFRLLISLETPSPDPLNTIELVSIEKPLRALDFCYHEETDDVTIMDVINLCVTVVAYAADSRRAHQMLHVLEAVLPLYLRHVERISSVATSAGPKAELKCEKEVIHQLALSIKTLLHNCEPLAKNYTGPTRGSTEFKTSSMKNFTRTAAQETHNAALDLDEDSHSRMFVSDTRRTNFLERDMEDSEVLREAFRRPRDTLLNIVADFLSRCSTRLVELSRKPAAGGEAKQVELLDVKCHSRLAEVAHSLLKVAPYDPETMSCRGLIKYMNQVLTYPDWSQESLKPTLTIIMRRLEKVFTKVLKKSFIRRHTDWAAAANLLKGVYTTLCKYPYIAHLQPLKALILVCQSLIVGESGATTADGAAADTGGAVHYPPPQHFASTVVRLIAMQMLAQGEAHSLEQVCGGSSVFPSPERTENMLMNLLLPLCLRVGCGRADVPKMRQADISFALTVMLHALQPPASKMAAGGVTANANAAGAGGSTAHKSAEPAPYSASESRVHSVVRPSIYSVAFLGLKILLICFEKHLFLDWHRVARTVQELGTQGCGGLALWDFLDFVVTYPTPVFILLLPFIKQHLDAPTYDFADEVHFKQLIREKLAGNPEEIPRCKSKASVLMELAHEMKLIKEEIANSKAGDFDHRKSVVVDMRSEVRSRLWTGSVASDGPKTSNVSSQRALHRDASVKSEQWPRQGGQHAMRVYSMRSRGAVERFLRRTSYAGAEDIAGERRDTRSTSSEPRLYRKSLFVMRKRGSRHSTAADSDTTPGNSGTELDQVLSPPSTDDGSTTRPPQPRYRLQRQKAQSRKTFRFRKSRRGNNLEMSTIQSSSGDGADDSSAQTGDRAPSQEEDDTAPCEIPETIDEVSLPLSSRRPAPPPLQTSGSGAWPGADAPAILSDVSPTSSSAAYRESLWLDEEDLCHLQTLRESSPSQGSPGTTAAEVSSLPGDVSAASGSLGSDHTEHTALLRPASGAVGSNASVEISSDQNTLI